ncbi:MAG: ATP phosphoribosyltransferase regulatory subunit, partial [Clostridia bacterium]|nr:ATP phosphoribosyltransferase regulatory subunit [Clostridia bacterium]
MIDEKLLKNEEKAIFNLRSLYRKYGYMPYRMSKFEEYELYIRNKDFLISDRIITFNDTNGKLLALKPDVTLSIIKNGEDVKGTKQKVYYNENVYRVSESTHRFKEIMQAGLECIGDIDLYDVYEAVSLAAKSLALISENFVLEISHLGILSQVIESVCSDKAFASQAIRFISDKNSHDLKRLCDEYSVSDSDCRKLDVFIKSYGKSEKVLDELSYVFGGKELDELKQLCAMLENDGFGGRVRVDFSVVNDMNYYNGFVFRGFLDGICDG